MRLPDNEEQRETEQGVEQMMDDERKAAIKGWIQEEFELSEAAARKIALALIQDINEQQREIVRLRAELEKC